MMLSVGIDVGTTRTKAVAIDAERVGFGRRCARDRRDDEKDGKRRAKSGPEDSSHCSSPLCACAVRAGYGASSNGSSTPVSSSSACRHCSGSGCGPGTIPIRSGSMPSGVGSAFARRSFAASRCASLSRTSQDAQDRVAGHRQRDQRVHAQVERRTHRRSIVDVDGHRHERSVRKRARERHERERRRSSRIEEHHVGASLQKRYRSIAEIAGGTNRRVVRLARGCDDARHLFVVGDDEHPRDLHEASPVKT